MNAERRRGKATTWEGIPAGYRDTRHRHNESLFREVNDRIDDLGADFGDELPHDFLCECGDTACAEAITLTHIDYQAVRALPIRFIVVPGHENPEIERVVEHHEGYVVVEALKGEP